jgi:hypothetical protein
MQSLSYQFLTFIGILVYLTHNLGGDDYAGNEHIDPGSAQEIR